MTDITGFSDSHMHMVDVKEKGGYNDIKDAEMLFSCTAKYSDWKEQMTLAKEDPRVVPFYGIHPWYVSDVKENTFDELGEYLKQCPHAGVGEIGIDKIAPEIDKQRSCFKEQLKIASELKRPVTIHMIRSEAETLKCLKEHGKGSKKILHSFMGPDSYIRAFIEQDCYFSLSYRFLNKPNIKLMQTINAIPEDRLLIESDAPMCDHNYMSMGCVIAQLSAHLSMTPEQLISLTAINAKKVIT